MLPITDMNYALVIRSNDNNQSLSLYQFNLAKAFAGSMNDNLILAKNDTILIFSSYEDATEEALQLNNFLDSKDVRQQKERDTLVAEYQRNYLRNLVHSTQTEMTSDDERTGLQFSNQQQTQAQTRAKVNRAQQNGLNQSKQRLSEEEFIIELHQRLLADFTNSFEQAPNYKNYSRFSRTMLLGPLYSRMQYQVQRLSEYPLVLVSGEVRFPGLYPHTENATVESLIAAAGGLKESAFLERAEITRTEQKNGQLVSDYFSINLAEALAGKQVPLRGRDSLHVLTIPEWNTTVRVSLEGEVRFPGTYTVRRGETLSALVQRAGGLSEYAFVNAAVFTRAELQKLERERMLQLAQDLRREMSSSMITGSGNTSTVSYNELNQLLSDLTSVTPVGRLVINLPDILSGSIDADVQLKDGDRLLVPSQRNTVNVIGEVQLASAHIYDGSLSVQDYLRRAGGLRKKADDDRIFIVKANGAVEMVANSSWFGVGNSHQRLEPGDTVVVPLDTEYKDNISLWRDATQILYQTGVALAAVATL
jgi:protein involved in polysaccharide export with SLBB domain